MSIIGLVVGAFAKLIVPGKDAGDILLTLLVGIAGSLLATLLGRAIGMYHPGQAAGLIMSLIGAIVLVAAYQQFRRSVSWSSL